MVGRNRVRNRLHEHGLACTRRRDNQATLTLAHRCQQVEHAARDAFTHRFHLDAFIGVQRRQVVEQNLVARFFRRFKVDRLNLDKREVLFALVRAADIAADRVAGFEIEFADLAGRNVNVVRAGQVVVVRRAPDRGQACRVRQCSFLSIQRWSCGSMYFFQMWGKGKAGGNSAQPEKATAGSCKSKRSRVRGIVRRVVRELKVEFG